MTAFTNLLNALVAVGAKPFATTIQALRDNPIAIAENDPSVPEVLRAHPLLGTITTTSGTSQSLTGLDLTNLRFVDIWVNQVGFTVTGRLQIGGQNCSPATTAAGNDLTGCIRLELATGIFSSGVGQTNADSSIQNGVTTYSNATTTITFTPSAGSFDEGSIRVYGVK